MKTKINIRTTHLLADMDTPVSLYLKVRDLYPKSALLESSDYHGSENSMSIIGVLPLAEFKVENGLIHQSFCNEEMEPISVEKSDVLKELNHFIQSFEILNPQEGLVNGVLGYMGHEAVNYFYSFPQLASQEQPDNKKVPELYYLFYQFLIVINPHKNELILVENCPAGEESQTEELLQILQNRGIPSYQFDIEGEEVSTISDAEHQREVEKAIQLTQSGELDQIVVSRGFSQSFQGDEFMVYRSLRSINPSPYLFYFDFGSFRIFGSSPETHCKVVQGKATIDPIAGTYFRTGDDKKDQELAKCLLEDEKEITEHDMLVDYATQDLQEHCTDVHVEFYKQVQFYSHVIHLVSRVSGYVDPSVNTLQILAHTFPAGTLVGSPKLKALSALTSLEKQKRGFYGGCIGYIGLNGDLTQAITIRTFLSKHNTLYYQAGGGIVAQSQPQREVQEVKSKLQALKAAIHYAKLIKR